MRRLTCARIVCPATADTGLHMPTSAVARALTAFLAAGCVLGGLGSLATAQPQDEDAVLAQLRERARAEGWTFTVGKTAASGRSREQLCGSTPPPGWADEAPFDPCPLKHRGPLPSAFDWRDQGMCTGIKDQGECGSCWAHAACAVVESSILIGGGPYVDLSEQWLVSCTEDGDGCDGGWSATAYQYMSCYGAITDPCGGSGAVAEADFPYVAENAPCDCPYEHEHCVESWAFVGSAHSIPSTDQIKQAILDHGPVATSVATGDETGPFMYYTGGVFNHDEAGDTDHAVVLVGWDDDAGEHGVWILRNSYGTSWGESGYMRIEYGASSVGYGASYVDAGLYTEDCNHNGIADSRDIADCDGRPECRDCNGNGRPDICDLPSELAPAVVGEPEPEVYACAGMPLELEVSVSGAKPRAYQWRKDAVRLKDATEKTLIIAAVAPADVGSYDVEVTNACGGVISPATTLVIFTAPHILEHPASQSARRGSSVTLSVSAIGPQPLTYQWRVDGLAIPNANASSCSVQAERSAWYDVVVGIPCGSAVSEPALVTIIPASPTPGNEALDVSVNTGLAWAEAPGASSYAVYFGTNPEPRLKGNTATTSFAPGPLDSGTTYYWKVVAMYGTVPAAGPIWSFTTTPRLPAEPSTPHPVEGAVGVPVDVRLDWADAAEAETYQVLLSADVALPAGSFVGNTVVSQWDATGLQPGTMYFWRVIAKNADGSTGGPRWSFTTAPPAEPTPDESEASSGATEEGPDNTPELATAADDEADDQLGLDAPPAELAACPATAAVIILITVVGLLGRVRRGRRPQ